jgi:hypothetical protein
MTKARSQQPVGRALRQPGNTNTGCVDGADVCELLLAELQARRQRLRKLLRLVWMEVESLPARRAPVRSRARCENVRMRDTA